ncbi:cbb3-type cytochrome oxidase assembly protein CcoS [Thiorhodospira sibirica]|uniref:cbb3-type cytochrome oxidase assembly protein CcoS n=1 Tax=Thiorhodospira sibirica TaxID=154347 RepID=UPI00022C2843|nr:cbb3-type cytochrome oxidase assembly protein CcoS [Thiorhodospira sibirica]
MEMIYFMIPLALVLLVLVAGLFWWAIRSGQYEDLEGPAYRILHDDDQHLIPVQRDTPPDETPPHDLPKP